MDKGTATIALVLVASLAIFASVEPLFPANIVPFSELGMLGPNKTIGNYPTAVAAGSQFLLYGYVGNHEGRVSYYQFLVKLGNQTTTISNSTYAQAPIIFTGLRVLDNNQSTTFQVNITPSNPGTNLRVIFELWSYNVASSSYAYTGQWNQLFLNVISH